MTPAGQLQYIRDTAGIILSMSLDTKRAVETEIVPGETSSSWDHDEPHLEDIPCYAWNRRSPGVRVEPALEIEELEWRIVLPTRFQNQETDITTEDIITAIWESDGTLIETIKYPLQITQLYYRRSHILLTAKEQR